MSFCFVKLAMSGVISIVLQCFFVMFSRDLGDFSVELKIYFYLGEFSIVPFMVSTTIFYNLENLKIKGCLNATEANTLLVRMLV